MASPLDRFNPDTLARISRLRFAARRVMEGVRTGAHRSPMHGASVEFAQHKEYSPGDELRRIDWKLFGKSDRYYVKQYEEETNLQAWMLLDASASMGYGRAEAAPLTRRWTRWRPWQKKTDPAVVSDAAAAFAQTKLDYASLLGAALAQLLIEQGDSVGVYAFGGPQPSVLPPRSTRSHLEACFTLLGGLTASGQGNIARAIQDFAPRAQRRSVVMVISDLLEDQEVVLDTLKLLRTRRNDVVLFHLLHADELTFPFEDVSRFEDPEARVDALVADPRSIREGYLESLGQFLDGVRGRCMDADVEYVKLDTSVPVALAVSTFLAGRAGRPT